MYFGYLFLLFFLISSINSDICENFTQIPKVIEDCKGQLSKSQIEYDLKSYCCYYEADNSINPRCISLTTFQYENIQEYIKFNELAYGDINLHINCNSFYLKLWIINLFLLFL